jgi:hypothetical protein
LLLNNKTSRHCTWPAQGRLGLSPKSTSSPISSGRDIWPCADRLFSATQEWVGRIDQHDAAGRPLLVPRIGSLPAPRAVTSIISQTTTALATHPRGYSASNDEVERRGFALPTSEADLSQSSTPSLAHRRCYPRSLEPMVRSMRWSLLWHRRSRTQTPAAFLQ